MNVSQLGNRRTEINESRGMVSGQNKFPHNTTSFARDASLCVLGNFGGGHIPQNFTSENVR